MEFQTRLSPGVSGGRSGFALLGNPKKTASLLCALVLMFRVTEVMPCFSPIREPPCIHQMKPDIVIL